MVKKIKRGGGMKIIIEIKGRQCKDVKGNYCPYADYDPTIGYGDGWECNHPKLDYLELKQTKDRKPLRCPKCLALDKKEGK